MQGSKSSLDSALEEQDCYFSQGPNWKKILHGELFTVQLFLFKVVYVS